MNSLKCIFVFLVFTSIGCGVKNRPLPPESPAPLGRGLPNKENKVKANRLKDGSLPSSSPAEGGK